MMEGVLNPTIANEVQSIVWNAQRLPLGEVGISTLPFTGVNEISAFEGYLGEKLKGLPQRYEFQVHRAQNDVPELVLRRIG